MSILKKYGVPLPPEVRGVFDEILEDYGKDDVTQDPVKSRLANPPATPAVGDRYLVIAPATGAWLGREDDIAEWVEGDVWAFTAPVDGTQVWVEDEDKIYAYDGAAWQVNPTAPHALTGISHTATGLTPGHALRALTPTTFDFGAVIEPTADEKAALVGTVGSPSATNPYVTAEDGSYVTQTTQDLHLYANSATGNDANDGLTALTAKATLHGVAAVLPDVVAHHVNIHLEGAFTEPPTYQFVKTLQNGVALIVDGGDGLTVIADNAGSPWVSDINSVSSIGLSTLGWTVDAYAGYKVEVTSGPAAGEIRTIRANSATTITPTVDFSVDPGVGAEFHIVESSTSLTVDTTPFDLAAQIRGGVWSVGGDGLFAIQRMTFKGNCPLSFVGGKKGLTSVFFASCVWDKPQPTGNFVRVVLSNFSGLDIRFTPVVYDPASLGAAALLSNDQAGGGSVGGDASLILYDVLVSECSGYITYDGCFFQSAINVTSNHVHTNNGARLKDMKILGKLQSNGFPLQDSYFGGLVNFGVGFPTAPGITAVDGATVFLGDGVDITGSPLGIYLRRAACHVLGSLSGVNALFGAWVSYQSALFFENGALAVTLTGAGGDLTWDFTLPVAGGFAGILGGTPVFDTTGFSLSVIQSAF